MESKRLFLDTNVVLDMIDSSRANHESTKRLWEKLIIEKYTIVISEDMLSTLYYIAKDKQKILAFFTLIQKRWIVTPFGTEVIDESVKISLEKNVDFEDLLQCICAKANGCEAVITQDSHFYDCGIKRLTIDTFLENH